MVGTLDMERAIEAHASDLVLLDVMKIGGVTGWLRAAALAHTKVSKFCSEIAALSSRRSLIDRGSSYDHFSCSKGFSSENVG
jgi:mandelate racemase